LSSDLVLILKNFNILGSCEKIEINTTGHINTTFICSFLFKGIISKYTLQKINSYVFKKPFEVMENIEKVTSHIQEKVKNYEDASRRCLRIISTVDEKPCYLDSEGQYWRVFAFIEHVCTYNFIQNRNQAWLFGQAVGSFHLLLDDFPAEVLHDTISNFHNMNKRYGQLEEACKVNYENRVMQVEPELKFLMKNQKRGCVIWDCFMDGSLKTRVTHNDTKINNVLFNAKGNEALCMIDFDTIMKGSCLFDVGDMLRTGAATSDENEVDLEKVNCDVYSFRAIIDGYLNKMNSKLSIKEKSLLVESGRTMTLIMAVRFLSDYLIGDKYYRIEREKQNLERAKNQIKLIKSFDEFWDKLI